MNGIGGDMFLLYYDAGTGEIHGLNASGRAGSAKTLDDLRSDGLARMPGYGALSVSVPGAVGGWAAALERFGTLSWDEALRPAAELARAGLPVSEKRIVPTRSTPCVRTDLRKSTPATPLSRSARIFRPAAAM
jgi:gamma-glutamyltranspeptidase/glutathione hydrolase